MAEDTTAPSSDDPGAVKQPGLRFLEAVVYGMGGLLVLMFLGLIGGIVWKLTQRAPPAAPNAVQVEIDAAPGSTVSQVALEGDRAALHITRDEHDEVVIIDTRKGLVIARIRLKERVTPPDAE